MQPARDLNERVAERIESKRLVSDRRRNDGRYEDQARRRTARARHGYRAWLRCSAGASPTCCVKTRARTVRRRSECVSSRSGVVSASIRRKTVEC